MVYLQHPWDSTYLGSRASVKCRVLSAYFLDFSNGRNRNLCEAAKRVFDREQESRAKAARTEFSSYRLCLSVDEARLRGYFRSP